MWIDSFVGTCNDRFGSEFLSEEFIQKLSLKLSQDITNKTNIEFNIHGNRIQLILDLYDFEYVRKNGITRLKAKLLVLNRSFPFDIYWKDNLLDGQFIFTNSIDIPDAAFEVWSENLNIEDVTREYYLPAPQITLQTSLKYELISDFFYFESAYLIIKFGDEITSEFLVAMLDTSIESWNNTSESMNRNKGVFHNWAIEHSGEGHLTIYVDFGSASQIGLLYILNKLNDIEGIASVKVTSYK